MKLCIIGSRGHIAYVIDDLHKLPEIEVVGICSGCEDPIDMLAVRLKEKGYTPPPFSDYLAMLDKTKPDIVCIDGPFECHAQMCIDALERNCHVFCEKPIALTLVDLDRIKKVHSKHTHLRLSSMVGLRYTSGFLAAWECIQSGLLGKIKLINTQKSYKLGLRPEFYKNKQTYGGTIPWVGSHAIDWIYWLGGSDFKTVYALHDKTDNSEHGDLEIIAQCQLLTKTGILASVSLDYLRPNSASTWGDDRVRIVGTQGICEVIANTATLLNKDGDVILPCRHHKTIFFDFVQGIKGETQCLVDSKQTYDLTKACLLARLSAETGLLVHFDDY